MKFVFTKKAEQVPTKEITLDNGKKYTVRYNPNEKSITTILQNGKEVGVDSGTRLQLLRKLFHKGEPNIVEEKSAKQCKAFKTFDEKTLRDFRPWSGAVDTKDEILRAGKADAFDNLIEELYPDGIEEGQLNDLLWFESEWIYEQLGMVEKWEVDYTDEYDTEEEAREAYQSAIEDYPEEDHVLYNGDELIEEYKGQAGTNE